MLNVLIKLQRKFSIIFWREWLRRNALCVGAGTIVYTPLIITPQFLRLGANVFIHCGARIEGFSSYVGKNYSPEIIISDNVKIQQNLHLTCAESVCIGKNSAIAANVTITDIRHPYEDIAVTIEEQPLQVSPVFIGEGCKIYNNSVILPGTKLGKHCVIGANSVVGGNIPDYSVVSGNPGRIIKWYDFGEQKWKSNK